MVITELDWRGRLMSHPLGMATTEAAKKRKGKQDIAQSGSRG